MGILKRIVSSQYKTLLRLIPDKLALKIEYFRRLRRWPDLDNPKLFTEKNQYRKLYDRNPLLPTLVDKVRAKEYVAGVLGSDWITPTLWHGPRLPPRSERNWPIPCVIKTSHGCGRNIFVLDSFDWDYVEQSTAKWLRTKYEPHTRQWAYEVIPPEILVEPFIGAVGSLPIDYKLFVFHGRVEVIEVDTDRATKHKRALFSRDWVKQEFALQYPLDQREIPPPATLQKMIRGAETLAGDLPFLRVDLYEIDSKPLFGELTLFPDGGFGRFSPPEIDAMFGQLLQGVPESSLNGEGRDCRDSTR